MKDLPKELIISIYDYIDIRDIFTTLSLNKEHKKGQITYLNYIINRILKWSSDYNLTIFYSPDYYNNKIKFLMQSYIKRYFNTPMIKNTIGLTYEYNRVVEPEECLNYNTCKNMTYSLKIRESFKPLCSLCRYT